MSVKELDEVVNKLKKDFVQRMLKGGTILHWEKKSLEDAEGLTLAALIKCNDPSLQKIITAESNFSEPTIEAIANALEKNIHITQFNFNYKNATETQEKIIKRELIANKAQKRIMASVDKTSKPWKFIFLLSSTGFMFFQHLKNFAWPIAAAFTLLYQGFYQGLTALYHHYFRSHHLWAKERNNLLSLPANRSYELGKRCANEWRVWLHPKSWTPLAFLAYRTEKDGLEAKYDLDTTSEKRGPSL